MKCLILGGGGFLGSHLSDALIAEGHAVRVFERPNLQRMMNYEISDQVEWFEGDFVNREDVAGAVSGSDIIYHLIGTTLPKSSNDNPVYDIETNVIGTLNMLESARKERVRKIIFVSSGGTVYGIPKETPIKESHPTDPICSYGIGKLAIEKYLNLYSVLHGIDHCILRLSNPYGERQRVTGAQGAVAVFMYKTLCNEEIEIWGDGGVRRDYIYVGDIMAAFLKATYYNGKDRVFNIGSGQGVSLKDLLVAIESVTGRQVTCKYLPGRSFDVPINILDITKAGTVLGWQPRTSLHEGLSRTLKWMLSHR
jgi:UDP-glucose 4-epimerase